MRAANDGLRFVLELGLLASFGYWGWNQGGSITRWLVAVAAPMIVAAIWGVCLAPKSSRRLDDPWRLVAEIVLFGGASAALASVGQPVWAGVFAGLVALHLVLTFVLDQRHVLPFAD